MRIVTNEMRLKRGRRLGTIMFFVSLIILTGGLIFTNFLVVDPNTLLFVPCIVMPLGLLATLTSVRLTNQYIRQPRPETVLATGLEGINRRSVLFNYFPPANHILLTPQGVYTLTTRYQVTRFKVEGDTWTNYRSRGPLGPAFLYLRQEQLGKPFDDALIESGKLQEIIDKALPESGIEVQPIVVFTSERATLEIINPTLPVVYGSPRKKPSIKTALREDRRSKQANQFEGLTEEEMQAIEDALVLTLTDKEREEATTLEE